MNIAEIECKLIENAKNQAEMEFNARMEKIRKEQLEKKDKEIERLNKRVKECEEAYLRTRHQYSELEGKYVINDHIINELEKWLKDDNILVFDFTGSINKSEGFLISDEEISKKIQALKGDSSNDKSNN